MENHFLQIKSELKDFLISYAEEIGELESITPIGSHSESKKMEQMNDLDFVFIFNKVGKAKWDDLVNKLQKFADERSNDELGIVIETRLGPFKTPSGKPITVQIHVVISDLEEFKDYATRAPLAAFDWQKHPPIYGKSLAEIFPMPFITADNLINDRGGIEYYKQVLTEQVNITITLSFDENDKLVKELKKAPQNMEQKAELCFKSIKNVLSDVYKLENKVNEKPNIEKIYEIAGKVLGDENVTVLKELESVYNRARNNEDISDEELSKSQENAKRLLDLIKAYVESQLL